MSLCSVELLNFRGICHLKLELQEISVLLGENQWGRSTLLEAFSLFLSQPLEQTSVFYTLIQTDFYKTSSHLNVLFKFNLDKENDELYGLPHLEHKVKLPSSTSTTNTTNTESPFFYYQVLGFKHGSKVATVHQLLDEQQKVIVLESAELVKWVNYIKKHTPILTLGRKENSFLESPTTLNTFSVEDKIALKSKQLWWHLSQHSHNFPIKKFEKSIQAFYLLVARYLFSQGYERSAELSTRVAMDQSYWSALSEFTLLLSQLKKQDPILSLQWQQALTELFLTWIYPNMGSLYLKQQPILLIQNIENHFHPIMLAIVWGIFAHLPLQKIVVTNSGVLLSLLPLDSICRIVREQNLSSYQLLSNSLSHSEKRRLEFHIQLNRSAALFARYWLLVEGETEIWLLSELSKQAGYLFDNEGVKIIEFAQCGLKPLLKLAHGLGIGWHVMTDSDDAGQKYAQIVTGFCRSRHYDIHRQLTVLTSIDIEHFMFNNGFAEVYYKMAQIEPENSPLSQHKVIQYAIRQSSKPDLALEVAEVVEQRGYQAIPLLLRNMFNFIIQQIRKNREII